MAGQGAGSANGMNAGAQAVAAVVAVGGLLGGAWAFYEIEENLPRYDGPAVCSAQEDEELPAGYLSGPQLCEALNRPDLPALLGTPGEQALAAGGGVAWSTPLGGTKIATPGANVQLTTYSMKLSASYDPLSVTDMADLLGLGAQKTTVLGRPAVLSSDRTIAVTFDHGKTGTGPGGIARRLIVAKDVRDTGGSYEVVIWREDGRLPDDAALLRAAEGVLPAIPGWSAG
ncbi:DUF6215 domain-containing protein [Streptomyces sp. NPDC046685]|uniref:DUF6215 domain-containing protein n=1 Tax=Streptomyces sp. NPDC046685 TaxID=3157202 RepID=UPI00340B3CD2